MFSSNRRLFAMLVARANAARDEGRPDIASAFYAECVRLQPRRADLQIQCGHMFKESGRLIEAERHYRAALTLLPDDSDLALQLGHLFKVLGRADEAKVEYRRALQLRPEWPAAHDELRRLEMIQAPSVAPIDAEDVQAFALSPEIVELLVPALAPRRRQDLTVAHAERIEVNRLGRREAGPWGVRRTLRGVETVHGFVLSETKLVQMHVLVNAMLLSRGQLCGGYKLEHERDQEKIAKYVFNHWIDVSAFASGLHALELRFMDDTGATRSWHDTVVIADPVAEELYPDSDVLIDPPEVGGRSLEAVIRGRPSQVHPARRMLFPNGVTTVLVMRTDQLGDLVASIPALGRLRQIVPQARIVGLVNTANADLAGTLTSFFDEIITIDFPDVPQERRRVMPLEQQEKLRARLEPYRFDMAIDLSRSPVSRELLLLSGARFLCGGGGGDWPFLSLDLVFNTNDRWNGHDMTPHSVQVRALIEVLGAALAAPAPIIRRDDLPSETLIPFGINSNDQYVVLHLGARIAFARWPYFAELAELLLRETGLKIVALTEDEGMCADWPTLVLDHPRFLLIDRRLPFDHFDALLSFATVMVGNDSGPKHLASLRGTPTVTIFSSRINWTEWGQENIGVIISRKLPCAGCAIHHEPENCGKDFACISDIRPEEVFAQVTRFIDASPQP